MRLREAGIDVPSSCSPTSAGGPTEVSLELTPTVYRRSRGLVAAAPTGSGQGRHRHDRVGYAPGPAALVGRRSAGSGRGNMDPLRLSEEVRFHAPLSRPSTRGIWSGCSIAHLANTARGILTRGSSRHGQGWHRHVLVPPGSVTSVRSSTTPGDDDRPGVDTFTTRAGDRPRRSRRALTEDSNIVTIPIGYADGLPRGLSDRGEVLIGGHRHPLAGTVTMDQIVVDVAEMAVQVGDEVVLIGRQGEEEITADEWADLLGTIAYEVVCQIGPRLPRRYS